MANINKIKTDTKKENEGVWVKFALGIELKIARARNSAYREVLKSLTEPHVKRIRDDGMEMDEMNGILKEVRAKTILLDWKNIEDETGKTIKYSSEKALEFFNDPELKDFYTFVVVTSEDLENFKKEIVEESEKN